MTSTPLRPVPTISTVRTAAAKPAGAVSAFWDTCTGIRVSYQNNRAWVQFCAVAAILLTALGLWLAHFAAVMLGLLIVWAVMVVWAWRQKHADADGLTADGLIATWAYPSRWLGRMLLGPVAVTLLVMWAWAQHALRWPLVELASVGSAFGIVLVLAVMERVEENEPSRWDEETLSAAFAAAGIKGDIDGRLGKPQKEYDDAGNLIGQWHSVRLSPGQIADDAAARRKYLASAFEVDEDLITVEHAGGPPNRVRVHIAERVEAIATPTVVSSPLCEATQTDASQPVRIGLDRVTGEPVYLHTNEHSTLVAGVPGYGKTVTVRMPLGHYLLDPTADIYGLDGKGSKKDYGAVEPLCKQWVWGTKEDADEQTLHMLRTFLTIIRERNDGDYEGAVWTPALLLLEEFQDIRAGATKLIREEMDTCVGRILRMERAVNGHMLFSTQRPSVEDLPSGARNLVDQRIVLVVRNPADASLALGHTPPKHLPQPAARGEAIYADAATDRAVHMDYIDGPAWKALCARAAVLRRPAIDMQKPQREVITVQQPRTLVGVVTEALQGGPMLASALYEVVRGAELPESAIPATSSAMGRLLGKRPEFASRRTATGSIWSLAAVTNGAQVASPGPVLSVNGDQDAFPSADNSPAVGAGGRR